MSNDARVVFVAGGTSGINLGIAEAFAKDGAKVAVLSRQQEKVDAAVARLSGLGAKAMGFAADVREYDKVAAALASCREAFGEIDVLISGAAGNFLSPAETLSSKGFQTVISTDLVGTFNVMRAGWEHLRKPGASVINISAPQSWLPTPLQVHVCAAKAGIDQVTRTLAIEWGAAGIRVNSIAPGPIKGTEGMRRLAPNEAAEKAWADAVPLKRWGSVDEIAEAAKWLSSPAAAYVTGVVLPVDGGWSLGGSSAMTYAIGQSTK